MFEYRDRFKASELIDVLKRSNAVRCVEIDVLNGEAWFTVGATKVDRVGNKSYVAAESA
jgi:hypothetical protein